MQISRIWTIAAFEARLLLRTWKFWILTLLALGLSFLMNLVFTGLHYELSGRSGSLGAISPEFALFIQYMTLGALYALAVIWFSYDFRHGDVKVRVQEVLYSRALSNADLVLGKYLGILLPVILLSLVLAFITTAIRLVPGWFKGPLMIRGHAMFLGLQTLPGLAFIIALVFLLVSITRSRALAVVGASAAYVVASFVFGNVEFGPSPSFQPVFDIQGDAESWIWSDLIGFDRLGRLATQRVYLFAWIAIFLAVSILLFPRKTGRRRAVRPVMAVLSVSALIIAGYIGHVFLREKTTDDLRAEAKREEAQLAYQLPTMVREYDIRIAYPGSTRFSATARMTLANDNPAHLDQACFVLNSGLKIDSIKDSTGAPLDYDRGITALTIKLAPSLEPGSTREIDVAYHGEIRGDALFLTSDFELSNLPREVQHQVMGSLGYIPGYVGPYTLLPGEVQWYPVANVRYGYAYPDGPPACFSRVKIQAEVPGNFEVISVGRKTASTDIGDGRKIVSWTSSEPVPSVPLAWGPYRRIATTVAGVDLSLYYHAGHESQVRFFEDAGSSMSKAFEQRLEAYEEATGLTYPYEELSFVEVPLQTRAYGDGWEMPNTLAQPGMVLIKENGFFKANFKSRFSKLSRRAQADGEGTRPALMKLNMLEDYIDRDITGGHVEHNVLRNFWGFRLAGSGPLHALIDHALGNYIAEKASGSKPFHSVYMLASDDGDRTIRLSQREDWTRSEFIDSALNRDRILKAISQETLENMDPADDPELFFNVMTVKGEAFIQTLSVIMGEGFPVLLETLMAKHQGGTFSFNDFRSEAETINGSDLSQVFDHWIRSTEVPGFHLIGKEAYRIKSDDPVPAYQVLVRLRNRETAPGWGTLTVKADKNTVTRLLHFDGLEQKEVGIVLPQPPTAVVFEPVLARNYELIEETIELAGEEKPDRLEHEISMAYENAEGAIIVDDLDPGFSVIEPENKSLFSFLRPRRDKTEYPSYHGFGSPRSWSEWVTPKAYGEYKHTLKIKTGGNGTSAALWTTAVPDAGSYDVYVYLGVDNNSFLGRPKRRGKLAPVFSYLIRHADGEDSVSLDTNGAEKGWNRLGTFHFDPSARAEVRLSVEGDGVMVSDAVKLIAKTKE